MLMTQDMQLTIRFDFLKNPAAMPPIPNIPIVSAVPKDVIVIIIPKIMPTAPPELMPPSEADIRIINMDKIYFKLNPNNVISPKEMTAMINADEAAIISSAVNSCSKIFFSKRSGSFENKYINENVAALSVIIKKISYRRITPKKNW